jgi:hypothetical protein
MTTLRDTKFCYLDHNGSFVTSHDDPTLIDWEYRYAYSGSWPEFGNIVLTEVDEELKSFECGADGLPYAVFRTPSVCN